MTTVRMLRIHRCLLALLAVGVAVGALAQPADAARPPTGRTYYTIALGLETGYDLKAQCFEFYEDRLCTLDGLVCGSWRQTAKTRREMDLSFDLTTVADGDLLELEGLAIVKTQGRRSSVAGTGRFGAVDGEEPGANFSFAGREVGKEECLALLEASSTDDEGEVVVGSGVVASEDREVSDFHAIVASGVGLIEIRHGATESLRITADDNLLPILTSEVSDGRLLLGADARFSTNNDIRFEITVRDFDGLTLGGVFGVEISDLDTERFDVNIGGVSIVKAAGRADHQQITIAGVSRYDAREVSSRTVSIDIAGPSSAVVRVSDELVGSCAGGALLEYIGNPTVRVEVDFISTLRRID